MDEFNQLRSLVYKISWVAKESRPEASGSASILAQHLKAPTVSDVLIANRLVKFIRSSASQCLTIWRHDPRNLRVISVSDAGGIGGPPTENGENVQNAHLIMVADDGVRQGVHSKASTLMWRSARCKRAVNSTLAGENDRDVCGPRRCRVGTDHDSRYFGPDSDSAKHDRRDASVDLAIVRERLKAQGSHIRGIPHPLMPADSMTKADPSAGERCSETLATHWKAGLGRRDNSTECTSWNDQSSQSSTVGNQW